MDQKTSCASSGSCALVSNDSSVLSDSEDSNYFYASNCALNSNVFWTDSYTN